MNMISIKTYAHLVNLSERTIRRHIKAKKLTSFYDAGLNRTFISLNDTTKHSLISLNEEDVSLILAADSGEASAQNEVALLFLEHKKATQAIYWLQLAAIQDHADAMCLLGDCYLRGLGFEKDRNLAISWISKGASAGSDIANQQMDSLLS